jgi:N-acetylglucosaminyldiphosphoundecaprenol N-acetyl-beta-D-mannosaminyltransferase
MPELPIVTHNPTADVGQPDNGPDRTKIPLEKVDVWGIPFAKVTMSSCLRFLDDWIGSVKQTGGVGGFTVTANLHYAMLHHEHPRMVEVTRQASMILADGMPIVWRSWLGRNRLPERVAGADLIYDLAHLAASRGYRLYLFGAADGVAQQAAERLQQLYPGLEIAGCCTPPFRQLSQEEEMQMLAQIRDSKPDIVLVALGQPKGEIWVLDHYRQINAPMMIQVGASFDFVIGRVRRAPKFFQRTGLEWLYRALSEPKRLLPRYTKNLLFLAKMLLRDIGCLRS